MRPDIADGLRFARKLTLRKTLNALKILSSYYLSKWTKRNFHWGLPTSISVEPTTSCNLRCPECPSGLRSFTRPTGMLQESHFQKIIGELSPTLSYLLFYFQGEPYLHPKFLQMIRYASEKGIYTATSTNGHFLTDETARKTVESGLDRLIISIDGTDQETYQQYRVGGNLEKVLDGARRMVKWKKELKSRTPFIIFQFLVTKPNEHQIEEVKQLAHSLGVDAIGFKTAQIYDYQHGNPLIPTNETYSRYHKQPDGTYVLKNSLDNNCWKMWHSCVVTWDGVVVPCCFDKDAEHPMGDLKTEAFEKVWHSEGYGIFRGQLLKARDRIEMCTNCTEGTKVWA